MTLEAIVHVLLNMGLLGALFVAPGILLVASWYRGHLQEPILIWKKPELIIATILFAVAVLILFITGISCLFSYLSFESFAQETREKAKTIKPNVFLSISILCLLGIVSLSAIYMALRLVLVQVITRRGIVMNDRLTRIPDYRNTIRWDMISDYYIVPDYPNAVYTLIVRAEALHYERISLRVPLYLREIFEDMLELQMYNAESARAQAEIDRHRFSEDL